jgi:hypothetical protein
MEWSARYRREKGKQMALRLMLPVMVLALLGQTSGASLARGDALLLKNGGELRGVLLPEPRPAGINPDSALGRVTIRTLTGALVAVSRDEVEQIIHRRPLLEEYETLRRGAADTVAAQWDLAEWCRARSLPKQRLAHLQRVVELDPAHAAAHRGLGHIRHEGRWTTTAAMMTARGYVKHKGRYVLPQELELIEAEEHEDAAEKSWYKRVRLWEGWLDSDRAERQAEALNGLKAIRDGDAVPALSRTFRNNANEKKRLLYIDVLNRIEGDKPLKPLIHQSLYEESRLVREAAVRGVRRSDVAAAVPIYLRALKNERNVIVNRAGTALGQLGDDSVVPLLIEALVTRHHYQTLVPDQTLSVTADGSMAPGGVPIPGNIAGLLVTGQLPQGIQVQTDVPVRTKEVTVEKEESNPSVLSALTLLTGEDFGFDEAAWRNWQKARIAGNLKPKKISSSTNATK